MILPLYALVFLEGMTIILLFHSPLRKPLVKLLNRLKKGKGPIIANSVFGTLFMILISIFYNMSKMRTTNHLLILPNYLLEASFLGTLTYILDRLTLLFKVTFFCLCLLISNSLIICLNDMKYDIFIRSITFYFIKV
ncbi:hypothetical protein DM860_008711 [Cuscuta australis]|uniref:Uncharacterized protein n=1 Tax=Cuscuta australis TaxID=267555 RepID=A0A328DAP3_9ASTE|nr:hypothetical protein DM860_008711 [Cuscuta australis]